MHFSAKCNSGRIAIQWFHIKHYLDYQYTKFQPYTFRVQNMCVFARYATLVPRLLIILTISMDTHLISFCKEPFPAVLYFCLTFILLDNFACSFDLLIFFKITLLLKQILSLIASVSKTKYEFRSLIEYK